MTGFCTSVLCISFSLAALAYMSERSGGSPLGEPTHLYSGLVVPHSVLVKRCRSPSNQSKNTKDDSLPTSPRPPNSLHYVRQKSKRRLQVEMRQSIFGFQHLAMLWFRLRS